jgi:hypothetical protein
MPPKRPRRRQITSVRPCAPVTAATGSHGVSISACPGKAQGNPVRTVPRAASDRVSAGAKASARDTGLSQRHGWPTRRRPEQREAEGEEYQREGRHPAMPRGVDHEGLDDPVKGQREVARATAQDRSTPERRSGAVTTRTARQANPTGVASHRPNGA